MDTTTEIQPQKSLADLFGHVIERDPYVDIIAKYSKKTPKKEVIPHTSKTYESLITTYTRTVERWCERQGVSNQDGCLFSVSITPRKSWLMQPSNKLYDDNKKLDAVEEIIQLVQNNCNHYLWKNPSKHYDKFIKGVNVVETRDRFGSKVSHHSHSLWLLHPTVAQRFNDELIDQVLKRSSMKYKYQSYRLSEIIHSIDIQPITNDGDQSTSSIGWLEYIFKNEPDQKGRGKWSCFDYGFSQQTVDAQTYK